MSMKSFKEFIEDSKKDENRDMIADFWQLVSEPDIDATELGKFLNKNGYKLTTNDAKNIQTVKEAGEVAFDFEDTAY